MIRRMAQGGLVSLVLVVGCTSSAYKEAVARRASTLPAENLRLYNGCVAQTCSVMISDLAMQEVLADAQLACLVDTDKGTTEASSPACQCSHAADDAAQKTACEKWIGYTAAPTTSAVSAAGNVPAPAPGHS